MFCNQKRTVSSRPLYICFQNLIFDFKFGNAFFQFCNSFFVCGLVRARRTRVSLEITVKPEYINTNRYYSKNYKYIIGCKKILRRVVCILRNF